MTKGGETGSLNRVFSTEESGGPNNEDHDVQMPVNGDVVLSRRPSTVNLHSRKGFQINPIPFNSFLSVLAGCHQCPGFETCHPWTPG